MDKTKVNRCDDCGKRLFVSCRNCKSLHDRLAQIEREVHDKEARIRELEGAMDEAWGVIANASDWIPKEPGTPCERSRADWQEAAERWRDERFHPLLRAASPPDSEPRVPDGETIETIRDALCLLEQSAGPFDEACRILRAAAPQPDTKEDDDG